MKAHGFSDIGELFYLQFGDDKHIKHRFYPLIILSIDPSTNVAKCLTAFAGIVHYHLEFLKMLNERRR